MSSIDRTKAQIIGMFDGDDARTWMRDNGRSEIADAHFPLGWVPLDFTDALDELTTAGAVSIVELPHRTNPNRKVSFVVRTGA